MIEIRGLWKSFQAVPVLRGIDLDARDGEVAARSGCGTTLGAAITPRIGTRWMREQMGVVFQQYNLFPHMMALDNVALGPRFSQNIRRAEAEALGKRLLPRVGIERRSCTRTRHSSQVVSSSGWRSPGPPRCGRRCSCWARSRRRSISSSWERSRTSSARCSPRTS